MNEGGVLASGLLEVQTTLLGQDCVSPPLVFFGTGPLHQTSAFQSVDQPACPAVGQDALGRQGLYAESPVVFGKEPEQHLIFGVAETSGPSQILFKLFRQPGVR